MTYSPKSNADLVELIHAAANDKRRLMLRGGGSKDGIGAPVDDADIVDMNGFAGVIDYDPAELVLTAGAGTRLSDIETLVSSEGQHLAFGPFNHGPVMGGSAGLATIGGVVAAGAAGSRRLTAGGLRDHLLGFAAVSGRGEAFVAGAKVVKNVTGYDLPKVIAGSWGRLVALTEVTFKVLPAPRETATQMVRGLNADDAYKVMAAVLGSQANVSAAAHIPAPLAGEKSVTAWTIEGFGPSIQARIALVERLFRGVHVVEMAEQAEAGDFWRRLMTLEPLAGHSALWRLSIPAGKCATVLDQLRPRDGQWMMDWGGGLIWLAHDGSPDDMRRVAAAVGGHAMLVRGDPELRRLTPAFHPLSPPVAMLEERVRRAFDPAGVFETGRFGDRSDAN